jgi:hypothetical protein
MILPTCAFPTRTKLCTIYIYLSLLRIKHEKMTSCGQILTIFVSKLHKMIISVLSWPPMWSENLPRLPKSSLFMDASHLWSDVFPLILILIYYLDVSFIIYFWVVQFVVCVCLSVWFPCDIPSLTHWVGDMPMWIPGLWMSLKKKPEDYDWKFLIGFIADNGICMQLWMYSRKCRHCGTSSYYLVSKYI